MRQSQGFTLIELLVALLILGILMALVSDYFITAMQHNRTTRERVPVQQAARGSIEVIAQELRNAIGTRVNYQQGSGSAAAALRPELPVANAHTLTLFTAAQQDTIPAVPPAGYPSVSIYPERTTTLVPVGSDCSQMTTDSYLALYSTIGTSASSAAQRLADASRVVRLTQSGCSGQTLNHTLTGPQTYNPNTYIIRVVPVTYFLDNGRLMRQIAGQEAQVVAQNITDLTFGYQADRTDTSVSGCDASRFRPAPTCAPGSVEITLSAQSAGDQAPLTLRQIVFLR